MPCRLPATHAPIRDAALARWRWTTGRTLDRRASRASPPATMDPRVVHAFAAAAAGFALPDLSDSGAATPVSRHVP